MKVYNLYLVGTGNVGDEAASPADYFDFPFEIEKACIAGWEERRDEIEDSLVILGGGGLLHLPALDYANGVIGWLRDLKETASGVIGWGIGSNVHGVNEIVYPDDCTKGFLALGIRDLRPVSLEWVPCVSCMRSDLDAGYRVKEEIVVYEHKANPIPLEGFPKMSNAGSDIGQAIRFIGEAEKVITNSYHGAYWGVLMGKEVVVYRPHSSKFFAIHPGIQFSDGEDLEAKFDKAIPVRTFLDRCRAANREFHKKVIEIVESR